MKSIEIKNAIIENTFLGIEYHDIFTFYLDLDYGEETQRAGGYVLGNKYDFNRAGIEMIREILEIVNVNSWEKLKGRPIRVKASDERVYAIGNLLKDKWLNFNDFFNFFKEFKF
jgi:hypothetical protein